jgi:hypothetical protein
MGVHAREDVHQRRFPGAVLTDQGVDLVVHDDQVDFLERG